MTSVSQRIEHVVVLMLENRSFDHLFGAFPGANGILAEGGGIKPDIYNLDDPRNPDSGKHRPCSITPDTQLSQDLNHDFCSGMMSELFGPGATGVLNGAPLRPPGQTWPATNGGFYATPAWNWDSSGKTLNGAQSLFYYEHRSLKVLHELASEFVLCDNWFCDTPGDTLLNRYFMHAAQTGNTITDYQNVPPLDCPTIFAQLGTDKWRMYGAQSIQNGTTSIAPFDTRFLSDVLDCQDNTLPMSAFVDALSNGTLPFYSFLMCWMPGNPLPDYANTSMHPLADIRAGENLVAAVYNALRCSPDYWENTLLVITFDENGGFYDHIPPPAATPPETCPPATDYDQYLVPRVKTTFDFTLLGPRVPALLVSPWLQSGIASGQYQNTSILRFLAEKAGVSGLNARDAGAPQLDAILDEFGLAEARTDCPATMPAYSGYPYADGNLRDVYNLPSNAADTGPSYRATLRRLYGDAP